MEVYPEALNKLVSMVLHPFPRVRCHVVDTLFAVRGVGKGINWTKAGKEHVRELKGELGLEMGP